MFASAAHPLPVPAANYSGMANRLKICVNLLLAMLATLGLEAN